MEFDTQATGRHKLGSKLALLTWLLSLSAAVWLGRNAGSPVPSAMLLFAIAATPFFLLWATVVRDLRTDCRRIGEMDPIWLLAFAGFVVFHCARTGVEKWHEPAQSFLLFALLILPLIVIHRWRQRLNGEVVAAICKRDFKRAVQLGDENPKRVRKIPKLRYNLALAAALSGDRKRGIEELYKLIKDAPRFPLAQLTLAELLLDEDAEEALKVTGQAARRLSRDPVRLLIRARALRRLGCLQEADDVIGRAIKLAPDDGTILTVAARISLDLGDIERAKELMDEAQRKAPGDAFCMIARAALALANGTPEETANAIENAAEAAAHNPLALLGGEIARLRRHPVVASRFEDADEVIWDENADEQ